MIAVITTAASVKLLANSMRRSRRFFSSLCIGVHLLRVFGVNMLPHLLLLRQNTACTRLNICAPNAAPIKKLNQSNAPPPLRVQGGHIVAGEQQLLRGCVQGLRNGGDPGQRQIDLAVFDVAHPQRYVLRLWVLLGVSGA